MDANQYYQTLLQQGHSPVDAAHFTSQYYPGFQPPMQGAGMMAPPPNGMGAPGMGSPYGGYTGGSMGSPSGFGAGSMGAGMAATGAAAGGGAKIAIITVVSVLVLGGAGTAGYFIYDYLTEPDFYGETYWSEEGMGLIFEEDELTYLFAGGMVDYDSDTCEMMEDFFDDSKAEYKNNKCYISITKGYDTDDKGDYYKVCVVIGDDNDCIKVYPLDGGAVMKNTDGECDILVSDIRSPEFEDDGNVSDDWQDDFDDKAKDIKDDGPSGCDYD